ncbi:MAG: FAD-dependent oxidoreductase, partial [Chloroflexi bacterium]|nr:FAD-dependent oxidoreductase [Chloroflexota bacterium]
MSDFSALFQPGNIGTLRLENRIIMPAMGSQSADADGRVNERFIQFYRIRAQGGVGLVIPSYAGVSTDCPLMFNMAIHDDSWIKDWKALADAVHEAGAKFGVQLMHVGMLYIYAGFVPKGVSIKVPSMTPWLDLDKPYHVLGEEDIERYVEDFGEAARRVKEAGADLVELHSCHGCLAGMFMSPLTNQRTDQYGGSPENRARFPRRVVERMRQKVGPGFPIVVRMNGSDDIDGGITIEEGMEHARIMESAGADAISVSAGVEFWSTSTIPSYPYPEGSMLPLVDGIKKAVKIPVIAVGKINAELAEQVIVEDRADFIAMGRPLLADPELPNKVREGRLEEVCRCIYCMNCLKNDPRAGRGACSVNPFLNREFKYPFEPAKSPKKVMVIGGGLSGMQTAMFLAERGHQVSLHERDTELGGQWNIACATPGKEGYATFTEYLKRGLDRCGVSVMLGREVTREMVAEAKPDAVVVATGAVPLVLNVPGATGPNVVQGHDVIDGKAKAKGRVVVVGGRFIGMEVAIMLAEQGQDVCIVTQAGLGQDGINLEKQSFKTLAVKLIALRVPLYLEAPVLEIMDKTVFMRFQDDV